MEPLIELNADVGEGGPDSLVMPHVQRVSIACGGHAGDIVSMAATLRLAREHGVIPGAHPGYPDPANFGRVALPAQAEEITRWVVGQTQSLQAVAAELGMRLFHVKPHGALYNRAAHDEETARGLIAAMLELEDMALVVLSGAPLAIWARAAGVEVLEEAFADRRYLADGQLVPRGQANALIEVAEEAVAQAQAIAHGHPVETADGGMLMLKADTLCLHGEGAGAAELARLLAAGLRDSA